MSKRALLLNADWKPLHFIDEEETIYLLYLKKAEMVVVNMETGEPSAWPEGHGLVGGGTFPAGATIRLFEQVKKSWKPPRFRKRVLFSRDNWQCQYCGVDVSPSTATVEHIIPSSQGGATSWLNCTTACSPCNRKKKNRTPEEAGMKLRNQPQNPSALHFWDMRKGRDWHPDWSYFLGEPGKLHSIFRDHVN